MEDVLSVPHDPDRPHRPGTGESNSRAKLTWLEVDAIRELHGTGKWTVRKLAMRFKVGATTIQDIVSFMTWNDDFTAPWP